MKNLMSLLTKLLSVIFLTSSLTVFGQVANKTNTFASDTISKKQTITIQLPFMEKAQTITVEIVDSLVIHQGDIVLGTVNEIFGVNKKGAGIANHDCLWVDGIIPYHIEKLHSREQEILRAIQYVNENSNLTLIERTTEKDFVLFVESNKCSSNIGRIGGKQQIKLLPDCRFGSIVHEIGHACGLYHEQSRSDRDDYVIIHWDNIDQDEKGNFEKYASNDGIDLGEYDYESIMHYHRFAFSENEEPTITPIDSTAFIGQRQGLSESDIASINSLYPEKAIINEEVDKLTIKYQGNYPSEKEGVWTNECQGISNNDNNWFITQAKTLWKIPFSKNLSKSFATGDGTLKVGMPKILKDLGYNHFGDQDNWNGYIFIPVQGPNKFPVIAVFDEEDLSFIDHAEIKGRESGAWCAINPITTHLTTSHTHITQNRPIEVYSINWDVLTKYNNLILTQEEGYYLRNLPDFWQGGVQHPMQGGDFSTDGCYLYLSNGSEKLDPKYRGLSVYKNIDNKYGEFQMQSEQGGTGFRYQFSPGCCRYEEPEGLTYVEHYNNFSDKIGLTHLHAILLDNDAVFGGKDDVYIKHYYIEHPSCGGCNDACAENYMPNALYDDGSCEPYDNVCDDNDCNTSDGYDSSKCECVNKPITAPNCNTNPCDGDIYDYDAKICECVLFETTSYGCTDETACNFNSLANCDDDSCDYGMAICKDPCYLISGCTNQFADNYNPDACIENGTCNFLDAPQLHPNPASSNISVTLDNDMLGAQIFITNIHGTSMPVVLNGSTENNTFSLDISQYERGIYYLMAVRGDSIVYGSFTKI